MTDAEDPEGYGAEQKLRCLERQTRAAKRVESAAMDEPARKAAHAKVAACQAKIRQHVASTSATRQPWRESMGVSKKALAGVAAPQETLANVAEFRSWLRSSNANLPRNRALLKRYVSMPLCWPSATGHQGRREGDRPPARDHEAAHGAARPRGSEASRAR